ncbi:MAG TPA: hypothetical protein VK155_02755 [Bacteroidales bacterium]|jgi:hypothetical protein|nr:hypothetical protein [Bacteroidales bacterium]
MFSFIVNLLPERLDFGPWKPLFYKPFSDGFVRFVETEGDDLFQRLTSSASQIRSEIKEFNIHDWQALFIINYCPNSESFNGSLMYYKRMIAEFFLTDHTPSAIFLILLDSISRQENLKIDELENNFLKSIFEFELTGVSDLKYSLLKTSAIQNIKNHWKLKQSDIKSEKVNTGRNELSDTFTQKYEKNKNTVLGFLKKEFDKINFQQYDIGRDRFLIDRKICEEILHKLENELDGCLEDLDTKKDNLLQIDKTILKILQDNIGVQSKSNKKFLSIRQEYIGNDNTINHYVRLHELALTLAFMISLDKNSGKKKISVSKNYFIKHELDKEYFQKFFSSYHSGLNRLTCNLKSQNLQQYQELKLKKAPDVSYRKEFETIRWGFKPEIFCNDKDKELFEQELEKVKSELDIIQKIAIPNSLSEYQKQLTIAMGKCEQEARKLNFTNSEGFFRELKSIILNLRNELVQQKKDLESSCSKILLNNPWDNEFNLKKELFLKSLSNRPSKSVLFISLLIPFIIILLPLLSYKGKPAGTLLYFIFSIVFVFLVFCVFRLKRIEEIQIFIKTVKKKINEVYGLIMSNFTFKKNYLSKLFNIKILLENISGLLNIERAVVNEKNLMSYHSVQISAHQNFASRCAEYYKLEILSLDEPAAIPSLVTGNPEFREKAYQPQSYSSHKNSPIDVEGCTSSIDMGIPYLKLTKLENDNIFNIN